MAGFGSDLWKQMQKVRIEKDGTLRAPVKVTGEDGIVIGEPPLDPLAQRTRKPGLVARVLAKLRG